MNHVKKKTYSIFTKNTAKVNSAIANILAFCSIAILFMVVLSAMGFFEFGTAYACIIIAGGVLVCLMPKVLVRFLPDCAMKYYMLVSVALFVGVLGYNKNIGIYITYVLVPILSCFYFEPALVLKASVLSYAVMVVSFYGASADMAEVVYQGLPRMHIFLAYMAGFTIEFVVVTAILYYLVCHAKQLILEYNDAEQALRSAEKERQILNALCTSFTAAYYCDLKNDRMEIIKQKDFSHSAKSQRGLKDPNCYSEWLQYTYDNVVVKDVSPDYLDVFDADNLMERLKTEESVVYRHKTVPNDAGMEYFEATVVRFFVDERTFKVIIGYHPIDDLVAEEEKRRRQLEDALRAAKQANEAKNNFLHRMSHDIRTPLNGIIGLLKINEAHFDNREIVLENYKKMEMAANHLLSLINDVLQMSKLEEGHTELTHERISLVDLTADIVNIIIGRAVDNGIDWNYEKGKEVIPYPYIYGSPVHLRQIFLNIYGNCIKYNRPGGTITTIVDTLAEHDGICTYRWTITDTGVGMSKEFLAHIFEPFVQEHGDARSTYEGTGLGMSIVKSLLDKMGGTISITSEEGVGSTFVIVIPFEIAPAPEALPENNSADKASIKGIRLMLAEDNDLNAEIAQTLLRDAGAIVTVVRNGKEAADLFEHSEPGTFDAILMDVMMPVMDGLAATEKIRALERPDAKTVPIIAMTANAFAEDAEKCLAAGMNAHLAKPIVIDSVVKVIVENVTSAKK